MSEKKQYSYDALTRYAKRLGFGEIHTLVDKKTRLHAIIAINSTVRGPAIGGCRFKPYASVGEALHDVLRLSYMMTLKAAVSELPHGGAKAVIMQPKNLTTNERRALFARFAQFVDELGGQYITSVDVGSTTQDMDIIAGKTAFVTGASGARDYDMNPSVHTAIGVFNGIRAAVQHKMGKDNLNGVRIAVQGVGQVAYPMIERLAKAGADLTVCDINDAALARCVKDFGAKAVDVNAIYDVDADVFAPCALGGVINIGSLERLKCQIVAGSANNQLAHARYARLLQKRGILYAPDFMINAGGLMCASANYLDHNCEEADRKVERLYHNLLQLFERAEREQLPTTVVAEQIAKENIVAPEPALA